MTGFNPGAPDLSRVLALVVAHNEGETIAATVASLRTLGGLQEILVVDDGSTDATALEAAAAGVRVLVAPENLGKGSALERALERLPDRPAYLLVDADVGDTASEAAVLLEPVLGGELDLAIGRLPRLPGGGFGLVKRLARWCIRRSCGFDPQEPLSGQRAVAGHVLAASRPLAPGFGLETAMTIDAVRLGFRVGEVPVAMRHRPTGRRLAGFVHRGRQGVDILRAALPRLARLR